MCVSANDGHFEHKMCNLHNRILEVTFSLYHMIQFNVLLKVREFGNQLN